MPSGAERPIASAGAMRVLSRTGSRPRALVSQLDLARSTGLSYALWRRRERAVFARQGRAARNSVYRAIWQEAADELHADLVDLSADFLEIRRGGARSRVMRQAVALDSEVALALAADKPLVHGLLRASGIAVPDHVELELADPGPALDFLRSHTAPCVVKPAGDSGGGWGVTGAIRCPRQLLRAALNASRYSRRLMIERHIAGDVYRVLLLDGEVLDVVRRRSPSVVGDGRSTIAELMMLENRRRTAAGGHEGLWPLRVDLDCLFTLEASGLDLRSVPPAGRLVQVRTSTSENRLEDNETVREPLAEKLVEELRTAARVVGLRLAGIDLITPDPGRSLGAAGATVLEVNGAPGLTHHYHVADRARATRVAVPILRTLLAPGRAALPGSGRGSAA